MPLTGTAASGNRPDHLHIGRVHLEVTRDTDPQASLQLSAPGGTARSAHNRHPLRCSQSAHRPRWYDRSPPEPSPVSFVPFDIRLEHPLAPTGSACSSNSREETAATPARPELRLAQASAIPGSGSWQSCPAPKHIAQRHLPNARLSWVSRYRRSPARHRGRRRAYLLEQAVLFPLASHPNPARNEVVQLIIFPKRKTLRHRLNAFTIARADQPRYVERAHLPPRFMTQSIQKRLEPTSKLFFPIQRPTNHGRPLQRPTTHKSQKN